MTLSRRSNSTQWQTSSAEEACLCSELSFTQELPKTQAACVQKSSRASISSRLLKVTRAACMSDRRATDWLNRRVIRLPFVCSLWVETKGNACLLSRNTATPAEQFRRGL